MCGQTNSPSFQASRRNRFLASILVFFASLSPGNGNLPGEMAIKKILWEWVLFGMTMAYGLSLFGVRAAAQKIKVNVLWFFMTPYFSLPTIRPLTFCFGSIDDKGPYDDGNVE